MKYLPAIAIGLALAALLAGLALCAEPHVHCGTLAECGVIP